MLSLHSPSDWFFGSNVEDSFDYYILITKIIIKNYQDAVFASFFLKYLYQFFLIIRATARALVTITWKSISLKSLDTIRMKEMRATENADLLAP